MKKRIFSIVIGLIFTTLSCSKKGHVGPELAPASSNFMLTAPLTPKYVSANYRTQKNFYKAQFNERVNWTLTLKGEQSQALRIYTGIADHIDSASTLWDGKTNGNTSDLNIFLRSERVIAELAITAHPTIYRDTTTIIAPYNYGLIINDFELAKKPTLYGFYESDLRDVGKDTYSSYLDSLVHPPQGKKYFQIDAFDGSKDYYVTNLGFNANQNGNPPMFNFTTSSPFGNKNPSADSLYINMFIYGNGPSNKSKLGIQLSETDILYKDNVGYDQPETYTYDVTLDFTGWKLISIKYSDFVIPNYILPNIPKNLVVAKEPAKINSFAFLVQTLDNAGSVFNAKIDYPILTFGKPLLESND